MRESFPIRPILLGVAVLSAYFGTPAVGQATKTSGPLALVGGTIYTSPTEDPIYGSVILIQNGRIAAVGASASVQIPRNVEPIDCSGLTIVAGFWNSHVHFFERKWANVAAIPAPELNRQLIDMLTAYGFTSVFDIGSTLENTRRLRSRIESGEVPGPRIRSTGEALVASGAVPSDAVLRALGFMITRNFEITDSIKATMAVRQLLDAGADGIKVHLQPPPPPNPPFPEGAIEAAVREAHRAGKPVFVHPIAAPTCSPQSELELMSLRTLLVPGHGTKRPLQP